MEPICNLILDNLKSRHELDTLHELTERSILARLHVLDNPQELEAEQKVL